MNKDRSASASQKRQLSASAQRVYGALQAATCIVLAAFVLVAPGCRTATKSESPAVSSLKPEWVSTYRLPAYEQTLRWQTFALDGNSLICGNANWLFVFDLKPFKLREKIEVRSPSVLLGEAAPKLMWRSGPLQSVAYGLAPSDISVFDDKYWLCQAAFSLEEDVVIPIVACDAQGKIAFAWPRNGRDVSVVDSFAVTEKGVYAVAVKCPAGRFDESNPTLNARVVLVDFDGTIGSSTPLVLHRAWNEGCALERPIRTTLLSVGRFVYVLDGLAVTPKGKAVLPPVLYVFDEHLSLVSRHALPRLSEAAEDVWAGATLRNDQLYVLHVKPQQTSIFRCNLKGEGSATLEPFLELSGNFQAARFSGDGRLYLIGRAARLADGKVTLMDQDSSIFVKDVPSE